MISKRKFTNIKHTPHATLQWKNKIGPGYTCPTKRLAWKQSGMDPNPTVKEARLKKTLTIC